MARTPEELAPIVAETIRNGYIARSMTITGQETRRGQLIQIPVMEMAGVVCRLGEDKEGLFTLQVVEDQQVFKDFMLLVIKHRRNNGHAIPNSVVEALQRFSEGINQLNEQFVEFQNIMESARNE